MNALNFQENNKGIIKRWCNIKFILYINCVLLIIPKLSDAQFRFCGIKSKNDSTKNISVILLPAIFKSPETGLALGLAGSLSFKTTNPVDPLTRTSFIQVLNIFTTKKQNLQSMKATIFTPQEKYIYNAQISHSFFPDKFWGIGPGSKDENKEDYVFEQFYFFSEVKRKIRKKIFAGLVYEYQNVYKINYIEGGIFEREKFYGKTRYKVSGLGFSLSYDTRNRSFWPTKGILVESLLDRFDRTIGSDYNFTKWIIDIRYFYKVYKKTVLAFQLYNYTTFGATPLRNMAALGGLNNMRGIYAGRFRDNNFSSFIAEYRIPLVWRLGICIFGDVGNVYNKLSDWQKFPLKYSYGMGLRIALLKKEMLNFRLDYGFYNQKNNGFYFTVGECF